MNVNLNAISYLNDVASEISGAIAGKGVEVPAGAKLQDCPGLIAQIPSGGSGGGSGFGTSEQITYGVLAYPNIDTLLADEPEAPFVVGIVTTVPVVKPFHVGTFPSPNPVNGSICINNRGVNPNQYFTVLDTPEIKIDQSIRGVFQYQGTIWKSVPTRFWYNGAWTDIFRQGIFDAGDRFIPFTGNFSGTAGTTIGSGYLQIYRSSSTAYDIYNNTAMDVSPYEYLVLDVAFSVSGSAGSANIGLTSTKNGSYVVSKSYSYSGGSVSRRAIVLPLINIAGDVYFRMSIGNTSGANHTITCYSAYLY